MSKTIKLTIRARGEVDSPTVEDLLDQLRDYFAILRGVEEAISGEERPAIDWRIVKATTNTPIMVEAAAFPREYGVNIEARVDRVEHVAALGLHQLSIGGERPKYFNDAVLARAENLFRRVTNGLVQTKIEYSEGLPGLNISPMDAHVAVKNVHAILNPPFRPYDELGSIEGYAKSIDTDGFNRQLLYVKYRLTGEIIKCIVQPEAMPELEKHKIGDVWHGRRVQVFGKLHYKAPNNLSQVEATQIRFLRDRSELPDVETILDERFTGGLRSEEYLDHIRDGKIS